MTTAGYWQRRTLGVWRVMMSHWLDRVLSGVSIQRNARKKVRNKRSERKKSTQQT